MLWKVWELHCLFQSHLCAAPSETSSEIIVQVRFSEESRRVVSQITPWLTFCSETVCWLIARVKKGNYFLEKVSGRIFPAWTNVYPSRLVRLGSYVVSSGIWGWMMRWSSLSLARKANIPVHLLLDDVSRCEIKWYCCIVEIGLKWKVRQATQTCSITRKLSPVLH